jgi:hypothetical protein
VAIITGAFAVLAALLTVGPKYLALPGAHKAAETTANSVQRPMTVDEFKAALTDRSLVTKISGGAKLPRLETSICARATSTDSIFGARRR